MNRLSLNWNFLWTVSGRVSGSTQIHWAVALVVVQGLLAIPGWVISIPVPGVAAAQVPSQQQDQAVPIDAGVRLDQLLTNLVLELSLIHI